MADFKIDSNHKEISILITSDTEPQGTLVVIGGNEDKEHNLDILRKICELPPRGSRTVELIPTASNLPHEISQQYIQAFGKIGIPEVNIMDIKTREEANDPALVQRVLDANVVFFTGGDQLRITNLLGGSKVLETLRGHYMRGGAVAGTSAGAAVMSETMIYGGEAGEAMRKGSVRMTAGLGFIRNVVVDTHFIMRGRFSRLLEVVASNPGHIGLGLDEDAGVIIRQGRYVEVIGPGVVLVIDAHDMRHSNITQIEMGQAIAAENIAVHSLVKGYKYDLITKEFIYPDEIPVSPPEDS